MNKKNLWIGFLIVLIIWQLMHNLLDPRLIPSPSKTLVTMWKLVLSGELLIHSMYSLYRLIIAVFFAIILGLVTGIIMAMNTVVEKLFAPVVYILFPVPKAALLPIIFVIFGLGDVSKIILIYLILYFQVVLSVYDAVKNISSDILISARTLRLSKVQLYIHIVLPAIFPSVLSTIRISVGIGIAVLFFAETYATSYGLGYFIMSHWSMINYEEMYAGILMLGAIGYVIFYVIDYIRFKLVKWM